MFLAKIINYIEAYIKLNLSFEYAIYILIFLLFNKHSIIRFVISHTFIEKGFKSYSEKNIKKNDSWNFLFLSLLFIMNMKK